MIRRGFVQLGIQDWKNLPASYAGRLHIMLTEMDKVEQERQKQEADKARRG